MNLIIDFPEKYIPVNVNELINRLEDRDNRAVGRKAKEEIEKGEFSEGLIEAVKKAIQKRNKAESGISRPMAEARIDWMATTTDSDGNRKARKW